MQNNVNAFKKMDQIDQAKGCVYVATRESAELQEHEQAKSFYFRVLLCTKKKNPKFRFLDFIPPKLVIWKRCFVQSSWNYLQYKMNDDGF